MDNFIQELRIQTQGVSYSDSSDLRLGGILSFDESMKYDSETNRLTVQKITVTNTPQISSDVATKGYVDSAIVAGSNNLPPGTSTQYLRGDLTMQTLNQSAIGGLKISDTPSFQSVILSGETASCVLATDGSKKIFAMDTNLYPNLQQMTYVKGVTSNIQNQINSKENTITPGTTTQYYRGDKTWQNLNQSAIGGLTTTSNVTFNQLSLTGLTPERALYVDEGKNIRHSLVTYNELTHLVGVTDNIQNQFNNIQTQITNINTNTLVVDNKISVSHPIVITTSNNTSPTNPLILNNMRTNEENVIEFKWNNVQKAKIGTLGSDRGFFIFDTEYNDYRLFNSSIRTGIQSPLTVGIPYNQSFSTKAVFQCDSTTKGALLPRLSQAQKLAIENPDEGLEVYDTTSKCKSYYNGTNWFTPSWLKLDITASDTFASTIFWNSLDNSPDQKITYNPYTGQIIIAYAGVYVVNCSATFRGSDSNEEFSCVIKFKNSSGTTLAQSLDQVLKQQGVSGSQTTYGNASISYLLKVDANGSNTYTFSFDSEAGSSIIFDAVSHAYIHRIS